MKRLLIILIALTGCTATLHVPSYQVKKAEHLCGNVGYYTAYDMTPGNGCGKIAFYSDKKIALNDTIDIVVKPKR